MTRSGRVRRAAGVLARWACLAIGFAAACQSQEERTGATAALEPVDARPAPLARPRPSASPCTVREVARDPIVLPDGLHAYVEARGFHPLPEGGFVLVGAPTYEVTVSANGAGSFARANRFLGVIVEPGEEVRTIPLLPGVTRAGQLRSTLHDDGTLSVIAGDVLGPLPIDSVKRVVHAELTDGRWSRVETILSPSGATPWLVTASEMVRRGGEVVWAAIDRSDEPEGPWPLVLHHGRAGSWAYTTPMELWPDQLLLDLGPDGLVVGVAGLDPHFGERRSTLTLFDAETGEAWARVPAADGGRVLRPLALMRPDGLALGWRVLSEAGATTWAAVGLRPGVRPVPRLLDEEGQFLTAVPSPDGATLFIVDRYDPLTGGTDLRVHRVDAHGASLIGSMPKPYTGPFAALATPDGDVLLVGPDVTDLDAPFAFVRSLVIRLSISC